MYNQPHSPLKQMDSANDSAKFGNNPEVRVKYLKLSATDCMLGTLEIVKLVIFVDDYFIELHKIVKIKY